jgi:hypothetical protein
VSPVHTQSYTDGQLAARCLERRYNNPCSETWYRPIPGTQLQTDQPYHFPVQAVERTVNRGLVWILESRKLLSNAQSEFRRHRSAVDHLVSLECHLQNTFLLRQDLLDFSACERHMTQLGGMIFSEHFTAGISGVEYHCFILIFPSPLIFASDLVTCYLRDILKLVECHKNKF